MMARRGAINSRSPREWGVRIILALSAAWLGWGAIAQSTAIVVRNRMPQEAYRLASGDAQVEAHLAMSLIGPEASTADRARADRLAREALRRDPTTLGAVIALAVNAQARGREEATRQLFDYAQALSRRDLTTQIWMIESAAARGDVADTMHHYDIALRTTRSAPELLWPILASALPEPDIRAELTKTLARRPAWSENFLPYIAVHAPDVMATADLVDRLRRARVPVTGEAIADVISRLIVDRRYGPAWRFYASRNPAATRGMSRDERFSADVSVPTAFDWQVVNEAGVTASIERRNGGGLVDFTAPPSVGGVVLRQMQVLPAGPYRLEGHSIGIDQPTDAAPYWSLACIDERELGRMNVPNSTDHAGRFAGRFVVPEDCPVQTLSLVARPSNSISGSSGQIDHIGLRSAI